MLSYSSTTSFELNFYFDKFFNFSRTKALNTSALDHFIQLISLCVSVVLLMVVVVMLHILTLCPSYGTYFSFIFGCEFPPSCIYCCVFNGPLYFLSACLALVLATLYIGCVTVVGQLLHQRI